jgi:hypothetical protein
MLQTIFNVTVIHADADGHGELQQLKCLETLVHFNPWRLVK